MTNVMARGSRIATSSAGLSLHVRGPAYSVVKECLRIQSTAHRKSVVGRVLGLSPLADDAKGWYRGAVGEVGLIQALSSLSSDYTILHEVWIGVGSETIDHLVIGPAGVFAIDSRDHVGQRVIVDSAGPLGGTLLVNGRRTHHIQDVGFKASRAAQLLDLGSTGPLAVQSVVAVIDPSSLAVSAPTANTVVVASRDLAGVVVDRESVLSAAQVTALVQRASRPATWGATPDEWARASVGATPNEPANRFGRLRNEVQQATRRRYAWMVIAIMAVAIPIAATISGAAFGG